MRYLFLLNPKAGKQDSSEALCTELVRALTRAGIPAEQYEIKKTEFAGHARELAAAAARSGEEVRIFAAGGDGTLNEALCGAYGYANAAVGCLPYGSGNDFLRTFGTREEFRDLDAQLAGGAVQIDMIESSCGLSATICAAGLDAQVAYDIPTFRRLPFCGGEMAYLLSIVKQLCGNRSRAVEYKIDGETLRLESMISAICNGRYYGGGFAAAPEACPDDGWLDVFIVRKANLLAIAKLLMLYKAGKHFKDGRLTAAAAPYFVYRRARQVTLRPVDGRGPIIATADGECGPADTLTAELKPLAANVLLPKAAYERFVAAKAAAAQ
jgi:YegS/Rv2252/BmrU family lipid kinase